MKKIILMLCLLAVSVTMYGCTSKEIHKDSGLMKITDDNGRQVAFSKSPERSGSGYLFRTLVMEMLQDGRIHKLSGL